VFIVVHLVRAGDAKFEEQRYEQRSCHEPRQRVAKSPDHELSTASIDLRRVTQHQNSADYRHEHRDGNRDRSHLPIGDRVFADCSLAAAGQCVIYADTERDHKKHAEK